MLYQKVQLELVKPCAYLVALQLSSMLTLKILLSLMTLMKMEIQLNMRTLLYRPLQTHMEKIPLLNYRSPPSETLLTKKITKSKERRIILIRVPNELWSFTVPEPILRQPRSSRKSSLSLLMKSVQFLQLQESICVSTLTYMKMRLQSIKCANWQEKRIRSFIKRSSSRFSILRR